MDQSMYEAALNVLTAELGTATDERQIERLTNAIEFLKKEHGVEEVPASDATE
jgi:hypothetical protein